MFVEKEERIPERKSIEIEEFSLKMRQESREIQNKKTGHNIFRFLPIQYRNGMRFIQFSLSYFSCLRLLLLLCLVLLHTLCVSADILDKYLCYSLLLYALHM